MAYAGICGSDNLQPNSDAMFHSISLQEMASFVAGGSGSICDQSTPTGNSVPTADAGQNYTIPRSTPFELTAVATDVDGDTITYSWEQRDLGAATTLAAPDNGTSPIERTWPPTTNPVRTIPRLSNLLTNTVPLGEKLPTANRTMDWRLVVRDNRAGGGGVATDDMIVTVTTTSGPFAVTFPNTAVTLSGSEVITWNVANTTASPVNAAAVDILLSTDGGLTFPTALAEGVPNDGSELVVLPDTPTTTARIKVKGKGNIFFDLSNTNFTIQSCAPLPSLQPDPSGTDKNRFVSLTPPFSASAAIRVNLTDLPPPFEAFEGQVRWVGPPTEYVDPVWGNSTWTAPLQCDPYFGAWSTVDVLHIYDPAIVPNGVYDIDASECGTEEGSFSPILQVVTSGWGDVVDPFDGPSAVDIAAVVDRVANLPGAIPRVSAKLQPNLVVPSANPSALDIADAVDANQGDSYPYAGPTACP
jgi:hypothetical protein